MALQSSGPISLSQIQSEFGGSDPISMTEYYRGGSYTTDNNTGVPTTGAISMAGDFYGTVKKFTFTVSVNQQETNLSSLAYAAGWNGSDLIQCNINSDVWIWSDNTSTAALTINVANAVVINNGKIIGKGGDGGSAAGSDGGPAVSINSTGITLINNSNAYIAGGGGGGQGNGSGPRVHGGGGGAGGGNGGWGTRWDGSGTFAGGVGGAIGQAGTDGATYGTAANGKGGGAGGGGGAEYQGGAFGIGSGGGGGGRILPGTGGAGGTGNNTGGTGGSSNSAGGYVNASGGGGGWGAAGGGTNGGAGGKAVERNGNSITYNDSGYTYGENS